jgi:hypothetical protein
MASIGENGARKLILPAPERKKKKKIAKYKKSSEMSYKFFCKRLSKN